MPSRRRSHNVGTALHRLRRDNGWTLSTVSMKTGVAVSTLSKIENHQTSPNYDVLVRLCEGLELNLAEFFHGGTFSTFAHGSRTVNRLGDGIRYDTPLGEYLVLSSELSKKAIQPTLVRLPKGQEAPTLTESRTHTGEEFLYVLDGTVKFFMEPYSATVLKAGESVHFDAQMPHGWMSVGDADALALVVCQAGQVPVDGTTETDASS